MLTELYFSEYVQETEQQNDAFRILFFNLSRFFSKMPYVITMANSI